MEKNSSWSNATWDRAGRRHPQNLIPQIIELYLQGRFPVDRLIEYYALEEINKAATDSEQGKVIKAVLRPNRS